MSDAKDRAAAQLRRNRLANFTIGKVKSRGGLVSVGLTLHTSIHNRHEVRAVACLEDGRLTELHIAG